jgi:hypothetical protein
MSISFLRSGALSVEVGAQSGKEHPSEPWLDVVKMWVYMPSYDKAAKLDDILNTAIETARRNWK